MMSLYLSSFFQCVQCRRCKLCRISFFVACSWINSLEISSKVSTWIPCFCISPWMSQGKFCLYQAQQRSNYYFDPLSNNCIYCKMSGKFQTSSQNTSETNKLGYAWKQHFFMGACQGDTEFQINLQSKSIDFSAFTPGWSWLGVFPGELLDSNDPYLTKTNAKGSFRV